MKYLILSDIHSNKQALNKVISEEKYDEILFLGDVVGYGGDPYYCYKTFLDLGGKGVMGNHEYGIVYPPSLLQFSENARLGVMYSSKHLPEEFKEHMENLPGFIQIDQMILCHSMLENPFSFQYVFPEDKDSIYLKGSFKKLKELGGNVMFTGHTHRPCIFKEKIDGKIEQYKSMEGDLFLDDQRYIINVGSVGQPRNKNPKAQYVVYDTSRHKITFKALDYDIKGAAKKIKEEGLPPFLGERLFDGI